MKNLRLFCPADKIDWSTSLQTEREVQLCRDIASRLGLAININEDVGKLFLGRSKSVAPANADVTYPSGQGYAKAAGSAQEAARYGVTGVYSAAPLIPPQRDDKLSEFFSAGEFMCHDSSYQYLRVSPKLVEALDKIRRRIGRPITVHSGYRPPAYNASIGGVGNSTHIDGLAADISAVGATTAALHQVVDEVVGSAGGVGFYPLQQFVHLDVRGHHSRWTG